MFDDGLIDGFAVLHPATALTIISHCLVQWLCLDKQYLIHEMSG